MTDMAPVRPGRGDPTLALALRWVKAAEFDVKRELRDPGEDDISLEQWNAAVGRRDEARGEALDAALDLIDRQAADLAAATRAHDSLLPGLHALAMDLSAVTAERDHLRSEVELLTRSTPSAGPRNGHDPEAEQEDVEGEDG